MNRRFVWTVAGLGFAVGLGVARADTLTWTGMTGDWAAVENWTNAASPEATRVPAAGDDAVISQAGAYVALTNASAFLGSLTLSDASLVMSNWDTLLSATNVTIAGGGVLTCYGPFTNDTAATNRVNLLCSNLLVEAGGAIDVNGKGWAGGFDASYAPGHGPGARSSFGASYGGVGRTGWPLKYRVNPTGEYGSVEAPLDPGSGGHAGAYVPSTGGSGGGAVRIVAESVVVSGAIRANATGISGASHNSAGSGGGIYITCKTIAGTGGVVEADAGPCYLAAGSLAGGGGGGRISVIYDAAAQAALPLPGIRFSAAGSLSGNRDEAGEVGTLYFTDSTFFSPTNLFTGRWLAPGLSTNLSLSEWTISNTWALLPGMTITVTNTLRITGTNTYLSRLELSNASSIACGRLELDRAQLVVGHKQVLHALNIYDPVLPDPGGSTLACAGDLVLTNEARMTVFAGLACPGLASDYGAGISAGGDLWLGSNCWIYPLAHPTNGASVLFSMRNLTVTNAGGFQADGAGYLGGSSTTNGHGPGAPGYNALGAGYGGTGSVGYYTAGKLPGQPYGSSNAPTAPGSGVGGRLSVSTTNYGPYGGGSVQVRALDTVAFSGLITANGGPGAAPNGGGSSGGGIYITCKTFIGDSNAVFRADGGAGNPSGSNGGGAGSGGRIAVWRINDLSPSVVSASVSGAVGRSGTVYQATSDPGTIVWGWIPSAGTVIRFR